MNRKPYRSAVREAAAGETRARIVAAAEARLAAVPYKPFSLEAVAADAGVTRLTVYKQFGGRRAVLESVFDAIAARSGMERLAAAVAEPDARRALVMAIRQLCAFWEAGRQTHQRLHAARAADPDLDQALQARNERRRKLLGTILGRLVESGELPEASAADLVDVLYALTGSQAYTDLAASRTPEAAAELIQKTASDLLASWLRG